jgi:hypothetical protein
MFAKITLLDFIQHIKSITITPVLLLTIEWKRIQTKSKCRSIFEKIQ